MKERPILFSAPMVRAILEGRKTQRRRIVKSRKDRSFGCELLPHELAGEVNAGDFENCRFEPGTKLWVRETWRLDGTPIYRASVLDGYEAEMRAGGLMWEASIYMPRWASRITLEITGVRIEKLQDIGEEDAKAEGPSHDFKSWRDCYCVLWESINGTGSSDSNPWVWVIEFKRVPQ